MIDLNAARALKREVHTGKDYLDLFEAAEALLTSIETEYGDLDTSPSDAGPNEADPQTVRAWQVAIHEYAKTKGWWDEDKPRSFGDICMLFVSEIAEAYEEYRDGHEITEIYENPGKPGKPEGIPTELADCVIRILDYFGRIGVDLQTVMGTKHRFNLTREYRHGGKRV